MATLVLVCFLLVGHDMLRQNAGAAEPRFILFFGAQSTELQDAGKSIVKTAAGDIERTHPASVLIATGARSGNNMELSGPRFAVVRQALIDDGVSQALIARSAVPGAKLAGNSATGDQRVEITLIKYRP